LIFYYVSCAHSFVYIHNELTTVIGLFRFNLVVVIVYFLYLMVFFYE